MLSHAVRSIAQHIQRTFFSGMLRSSSSMLKVVYCLWTLNEHCLVKIKMHWNDKNMAECQCNIHLMYRFSTTSRSASVRRTVCHHSLCTDMYRTTKKLTVGACKPLASIACKIYALLNQIDTLFFHPGSLAQGINDPKCAMIEDVERLTSVFT